jgi:hypothetical protein
MYLGLAQPWDVDALYSANHDEPSLFWWWLWLTIPIAGYLAAIVATLRLSTRRVGQGMLIGLTLMLPVVIAVGVGIGMSYSI